MLYNLLGKLFFPALPRRERRRKIKNVLGVLLAAVVAGGCVGLAIYRENFSRH